MRYILILLFLFMVGCSGEEPNPSSAATPTPPKEAAKPANPAPVEQPEKTNEPETPYRFWYNDKVLILSYHHLSNEHQSDYTIKPEIFQEHMKFLKENHFYPLKLDEFYEFMNTGRLAHDNAVLITFDDGYESLYWEAYPVLKKYQFPATMFVIYERLRDSVERKRENMISPLTFVQMEEMQKKGLVTFQSHTYGLHEMVENLPSSAPQPDVGDQKYRSELFVDFTMSKAALEKLTKQPVIGLSYPYSYYNEKLLRIVKKAGYQYGFTSKSGLADYGTDHFLLPKNDVGTPEMDGTQFEQRIRSIINRNKGK